MGQNLACAKTSLAQEQTVSATFFHQNFLQTPEKPILLKHLESVVLFVADIEAASAWYAELFGVEVQHENSQYAFIKAPGCLLGFHPKDQKCPGGAGGATAYWEVADLQVAIKELELRGAVLYRGPISTSFSARAAMLLDPFGCTMGINQSTPQSLKLIELTA